MEEYLELVMHYGFQKTTIAQFLYGLRFKITFLIESQLFDKIYDVIQIAGQAKW